MSIDISVIITSYNIEAYIEQAILSALNQHGVSLEVIVVDDASTDQSPRIIKSIADPRLHVIHLSENIGPGAARNCAIAQAKGEWIALLDGDDAFKPGRLQRMLALARAENADIVIDNLTVQRQEDNVTSPMFAQSYWSSLIMSHASFINSNVSPRGFTLGYVKPMFRAEFLRMHALVYNTTLKIGEDYIFLAECLNHAARCVVDPAEGYVYNARSGSASHRITANDLLHLQHADTAYLSHFQLDASVIKAQKKRTRSLKTAYAYARVVEAIKTADIVQALKVIITRPACIWLLWQPLWIRIKRLKTPI